MASEKQDLVKVATDMGIDLKGGENIAQLKELIQNYVPGEDPQNSVKPQSEEFVNKDGERMIKASDVKKLIAEEMARIKDNEDEEKGVKKVKRVQEHHVQIHRWDAKWVVDFVDRNNDPYLKGPVHAYDVWSDQSRQMVAHIELVLWDEVTGEKTTQPVALTRYIERRTSVYCLILKRDKEDISYSIGEVEVKKDKGDGMMKGTGVYRDQEVEMYKEVFEVKTPTGKVIRVPDYAVC